MVVFHHLHYEYTSMYSILCLSQSLGRLNGWFAFNRTYEHTTRHTNHAYHYHLNSSLLFPVHTNRLPLTVYDSIRWNNNLFASLFQCEFSGYRIWSPGKKEGSKTLFAGSFVLKDRKNHFKWLAVSTWMVVVGLPWLAFVKQFYYVFLSLFSL